jgi:hypothetical protein
MFVFYEDIVHDWTSELRRLAAFIGRPETGDDPRVQAAVAEFFEEELCHHRMSMTDLVGSDGISFAAKGLYVALRGHAPRDPLAGLGHTNGASERGTQATLDLLATRALQTWDDAVCRDQDVQAERDRLAARIDLVSGERERLAGELRAMTIERERLAAEGEALRESVRGLTERERHHVKSRIGLESELRRTALERERLARDNDAAGRMLQEIHASFAWQLVTACRHLIVRLLPAGTWRRRLFNALIRRGEHAADTVVRAT